MPTIQLLSDLHLELHADRGQEFIASLDPSGVDILVLAGDISVVKGGLLEWALRVICRRYPHVAFVCGNHEYWGSTPSKVSRRLMKFQMLGPSNFHWLDCRVAKICGVTFFGGTLWFPRPVSDATWALRGAMHDFHAIGQFDPWVFDQNKHFRRCLGSHLSEVGIIVTHHIPTRHGIAPRWKGSAINHYFCDDLTDAIEEHGPPVWMFGHTHDPMEFQVGQTKLYCNPFGYPHEPKSQFKERLLIEVKR